MTTPIPIPAPVIVIEFAELMERVRRALDTLHETAQRVVDNAWRAVQMLPDAIAEQVRKVCRQVAGAVRRVGELLEETIKDSGAGWPPAVWAAGAAWVERFAAPLSIDVNEIDFDKLAGDYHWDGRAAEAYVAAAENQRNALTALQAVGRDMHTALGDVAVAICAMWATVLAALLTAVGAMAGAAIAAVTLVGAALAAALALAAISSLLLGLAAAVMSFMLVVERANDAMAAIRNRLNDNSGFGVGDWPVSSTDRFNRATGWKLAE